MYNYLSGNTQPVTNENPVYQPPQQNNISNFSYNPSDGLDIHNKGTIAGYQPQQQPSFQSQPYTIVFLPQSGSHPNIGSQVFISNQPLHPLSESPSSLSPGVALFMMGVLSLGIFTLMGYITSNIIDHEYNFSDYNANMSLPTFIGASIMLGIYSLVLSCRAYFKNPTNESFTQRMFTTFKNDLESVNERWSLPCQFLGAFSLGYLTPMLGVLATGDDSYESIDNAAGVGAIIGFIFAVAIAYKQYHEYTSDQKRQGFFNS